MSSFFKLKNWAIERGGPVPKGIIDEANMMKTGLTIPIAQSIISRREKLGLPEIPKSNTEEIEKILKATKFTDKLDNLQLEVTK
jgi:heterodisulfide reductase subunit C